MFNKIVSFITAALIISGAVTFAVPSPAPNALQGRKNELSPDAKVCTGNANNGCVTIPISADDCVNFTGGLGFLNKEVTTAVLPDGFVCTFFENFGCESAQGGHDAVVLQGGTWSFFDVPGVDGPVDFNDLSSSFNCSPV
ncbi:hypothetical protein CPB84DRAFT_1858232 [Gymnopilus junonius]|uniref:Uncharacterized protein n=1 Tax=Gymnopilus junonius TaxID=109634 RepID=A0A9P5TEE0_GYMJU|nr:hypothetical protein CPB84DRAFT_1858232 [Gymnopilus junonius]